MVVAVRLDNTNEQGFGAKMQRSKRGTHGGGGGL